jgi:hypothetical protein
VDFFRLDAVILADVSSLLEVSTGYVSRLRLKCDGTRAITRFRLSAKRTSPFKSVGASVQSTTGSRGVRITGSNVGYTTFRGSVKVTGYPHHSPVSPSLPLSCVTVCHQPASQSYTQYDLVQKPSTLDALTGYFTPSHVKHQRLSLQFLSAPEDGRK